MIPPANTYEPTNWEKFKKFFSDRFPYWTAKVLRFIFYIIENVVHFIINTTKEAVRNLMGKY